MRPDRPKAIFIDALRENGDREKFAHLETMSLGGVFVTVKEGGHELPSSVRLLRDLDLSRIQGRDEVLVFLFVDTASIYLTQALNRLGIDWVWPTRLDLRGLAGVVSGLPILRARLAEAREEIAVRA